MVHNSDLLASANDRYRDENNHLSAILEYTKLLSFTTGKKKIFQILFNRGVARLSIGALAEAIEDFNECLKIRESALAYNNRALAQLMGLPDENKDKDKLFDIFSDLQKAIRLQPDYALAYYNLARAHERSRDYVNAYASYQHVTRLMDHPASAEALKRLEPWVNSLLEDAAKSSPMSSIGSSILEEGKTSPVSLDGMGTPRRRRVVTTTSLSKLPQDLDPSQKKRTSSQRVETLAHARMVDTVGSDIENTKRLLDDLEADVKETRLALGIPASPASPRPCLELPEDIIIHILSFLKPKDDTKQRVFLKYATISWDWYSAVRTFPTVIKIGPQSVHRLMTATFSSFRNVVISVNDGSEKLGDSGAGVLANVLSECRSIKDLRLKNSGIGPKGSVKLINAIKQNMYVESVDIRENTVGPEATRTMESEFRVATMGRRGALYYPRINQEKRQLDHMTVRVSPSKQPQTSLRRVGGKLMRW